MCTQRTYKISKKKKKKYVKQTFFKILDFYVMQLTMLIK